MQQKMEEHEAHVKETSFVEYLLWWLWDPKNVGERSNSCTYAWLRRICSVVSIMFVQKHDSKTWFCRHRYKWFQFSFFKLWREKCWIVLWHFIVKVKCVLYYYKIHIGMKIGQLYLNNILVQIILNYYI